MTFPKSILLLIGLSILAALVACSGGGGSHTPPLVIAVTVSSVTTPLAVNSSTPVTATTNDPAGVTWSVTCASAISACGTFSAAQTQGGTATNYIAPPAPTTGVVITATSVTTNTISASTSPAITITGATLADGTYVFSLAGEDTNGNFYVAGEITIAGGAITTGEQDFVDAAHDRFDAINGTTNGSSASTIAYTADGNVLITLVTCTGACSAPFTPDPDVGVGGTEILNGTILPLSSALGFRTLITEFDTTVSASGALSPQDLAGAGAQIPANGYAFVLNGYDHGGAPLAIGGIINVDNGGGTVGSISGTGSIFDANDGFSGNTFAGQTLGSTSSVSAPDAFGRVTFTLVTTNFSTIIAAGYIVDSNRIQLAETFDPYSGTLGGVAYSQSNGSVTTGGFTSANAAGTYVVGLNGADTNNPVLQVVNQLTLTAGAGVAGFVDYNDIITSSGTAAPATSPDPVTAAAYAVDPSGDVTISNINDGTASAAFPGVGYNLQLYLDGNGHALAISMDGADAIAGAGFTQGAGVASTSFTGPYGLDVTGWDVNGTGEFDGAGPVSATAGTISGTVDLNWLNGSGLTYAPTAVSGSIVTTGAGASNGVFTGTITGVDIASCILVGVPSCNVDTFSYYLIDATGDNIAIETDENQLTLGFFLQQ